MDPEQARVVAVKHYHLPEAAAPLIVAATDPQRSEDRERASRALLWLDRSEDLGALALDLANPGPDPLMPFALAVASVLLESLRQADERERRRLANLLGAVCREASAIERRRGVRAA